MSERPASGGVRDALLELQQYLSDQLAPLMVSGSVELLLEEPPELVAREVQRWAAAQLEGRGSQVPVSDYLYHAVKKLHLIGEFHLLPAERVNAYLDRLSRLLIAICPEEDRDLLERNLSRLGGNDGLVLASPVETIYRQLGSEGPLASTRSARIDAGVAAAGAPAPTRAEETREIATSLRRFGRLLERLERPLARVAASAASEPPAAGLAPDLIVAAAAGSSSGAELDALLARLRALGVDTGNRNLMKALGQRIPEWGVPLPPEGDDTASIAGAMRQVIRLAPDPAEGANRFREMVQEAIEQANAGSLARAVTMLELAERILGREAVEGSVVEAIRTSGHRTLDLEKLRGFSERPEKRILVRQVLAFFHALAPKGLLQSLRGEKKRDARRQLLALLEAHGPAARSAAMEELEASLAAPNGEAWYYQRNLLYVLRRVPRHAEEFVEAEVSFLERLSEPGQPAPLVKEVYANLGGLKHEKAEALGIARLRGYEERLEKGATAGKAAEELHQLVDRAVAALARMATAASVRAVVDHGLRRVPAFGDAEARLVHLGPVDLSPFPDQVDRLLKALRAGLPVKLFGLSLQNAASHPEHVIAALASTRVPAVQSALEEVARRHEGKELGRAATKSLAGFETARRAEGGGAQLTGDVELFGMPTLLQTLEQGSATGLLSLKSPKGDGLALLVFEGGKLRTARAGKLKGLEAVYQLLERPASATFSFVRQPEVRIEPESFDPPLPVLPLMLEGMRRYDELQRAAALVPDGVRLRTGTSRPTPPAGESDGVLVRSVWQVASGNGSVADCEAAGGTDTFRVRRLLAHWVEEGSLRLAE